MMKREKSAVTTCLATIATIATLGLGGCATPAQNTQGDVMATTILQDAEGAERGHARIIVTPASTVLEIRTSGLKPGEHGTHFHTVGNCTGPDFASAGGHLNPEGREHGKQNPNGSHLGDLPNMLVTDNGEGELTVMLPGNPDTLRQTLFDNDGTALVIHAGPDDYMTDPAGNAGGRILCGVLKASS